MVERLIVKEGSVSRKMNYILTIKGNLIQIWYNNAVVYEKAINNEKKDILEAYKTYKKLSKGV